MKKIIPVLLALLVVLLFAKLNYVTTLLSGTVPLQDFDAYYRLVAEIRAGSNPYQSQHMQTLGPPLVFTYYLPFSIFEIETARQLTTGINLLAGFAVCYLISKKYFGKKLNAFLLLSVLLFSAFSTRFSLEMGQPNLVLTLLVTLLVTNKKTFAKSALIALLVSFKTYFVVLVLAFFKKERKVVILSGSLTLMIGLLYLPFIRVEWYDFFLRNKTGNFFAEQTLKSLDYYNQTIFMSVARLGLIKFALIIQTLSSLLLLAVTVFTGSLPLAVLSSVLISPVVWQHYFVIFFPIYFYVFHKVLRDSKLLALWLISLLLWWLEFSSLHQADMGVFNRLLASHYLISGLLLFWVVFKVGGTQKKPS